MEERQHQRGGGADGAQRPRPARGCGQGGGPELVREPGNRRRTDEVAGAGPGHADADQRRRWKREDA
jgi:hypothetical protein